MFNNKILNHNFILNVNIYEKLYEDLFDCLFNSKTEYLKYLLNSDNMNIVNFFKADGHSYICTSCHIKMAYLQHNEYYNPNHDLYFEGWLGNRLSLSCDEMIIKNIIE